jgi:hypothetical protein
MASYQRKVINTTLGDLIAAVTDEVKPFARDPSGLYMTVSQIVNDLLLRSSLVSSRHTKPMGRVVESAGTRI